MQLGIVTGMVFEAEILRAAARNLPEQQRPLIVCRGLGRDAARLGTEEAIAQGAKALMSFGIAAGLDPRLHAGTIMTASHIHGGAKTLASDEPWAARLSAALSEAGIAPLSHDPITHAAEMLTTPEAKAQLRAATNAGGADMESYGIAEAAAARALPFATLRVVADTFDVGLPSVAVDAATPDGRVDVMKSVWGAITHPGQIPELIRLGRRTEFAATQLRRLADFGLARRFFV